MTTNQLKTELEMRGIEVPEDAKKDEMIEMAVNHISFQSVEGDDKYYDLLKGMKALMVSYQKEGSVSKAGRLKHCILTLQNSNLW